MVFAVDYYLENDNAVVNLDKEKKERKKYCAKCRAKMEMAESGSFICEKCGMVYRNGGSLVV